MERSILPAIGEQDFHLAARTAVLSFIVVFGVSKALTNYLAGRLSDRFGRKHVLVAGWLIAAPVPFMLMWAPSWNWILFANVLLGVSQGLTWSTTVIMKIDLAGSANRGLAMGLNEFAGYFAVAVSALATGWIAARYGLRPEPFYLGIGFVAAGLGLSALVVRETKHHVAHESKRHGHVPLEGQPTQSQIFWRTSLLDRNLSSVSQAGLVNNLPALFCRRADDHRADRHARCRLPGNLGHRAALHGGLVRSRRTQVAHRGRHVGAGWRAAFDGRHTRLRLVVCRQCAARHWDGHGLPDAHRLGLGCLPSFLASSSRQMCMR